MTTTRKALPGLVVLGVASALALTACGTGEPEGSGPVELTMWDPYPQFDDASAWSTTLDDCAADAGVTITREGMDTSSLTSKLLLAAQQQNAPDIAVIDNPLVASVAETGLLASTEDLGIDTSDLLPNVLAAGEVDGVTYGVPVGSNTLALFYNRTILEDAGVEPPTTWDELRSAVAAVQEAGHQGIGFSAVGTEEGSFQFLPFFWGAGADLSELDSPEAVEALTLWTDLVSSEGASSSVLNSTQADINDQFLAGDLAFQVNGSWQLAGLDEGDVDYGVVPIPAIDGGAAPAPLGGEFFTLPVSDDTDAQAKATEVVACMGDPENAVNWVAGLTYVLPQADAAQEQAQESEELAAFVDAVGAAQGRTTDLGTEYPRYSEQLWTALQEAVSGAKTPQQALSDAQAAVDAG